MPPSSPAMKMPGTLDSKSGDSVGMSTPRFSEPNTSEMAPTGHAARHAPWPMQSPALMRLALPLIRPSTVCSGCSGQARTQAPQPTQIAGSMIGCSETGSASPAACASFFASMLRFSALLRLCRYQAQMASIGST